MFLEIKLVCLADFNHFSFDSYVHSFCVKTQLVSVSLSKCFSMRYVRRSCMLRICSAELYEWEMSCCVQAGSHLTGSQTREREREATFIALYNRRCTWIREGRYFFRYSQEQWRKREEKREGGRENRRRGGG